MSLSGRYSDWILNDISSIGPLDGSERMAIIQGAETKYGTINDLAEKFIDRNSVYSVNGVQPDSSQDVVLTTDDIGEGLQNAYFLSSRVLETELSGISSENSTEVIGTDDVLLGVGKLQGQINSINYNNFTPEQFGAYGDAVGQSDGIISGGSFNQFSSPAFSFTSKYIGAFLWFDTTDRIITAVNAGVATFSPAASGPVNGTQWLAGHDDTVAIQSALDAARNVQGDYIEEAGGINGLVISGGICSMKSGKAYIISNSQANYTSGKLSALQVARRTDFKGSGIGAWRNSLCLRPNSYGHMVSAHNPASSTDDFVDFVSIGNMALYGYQSWNPNALDGIYWVVDFNGYDKVDTFNRLYDISSERCTRHGYTFTGRGETIIDRCQATFNGQYGFNVVAQADYKFNQCGAGGNSLTGIRISSSGGIFVNCKSYFNGASGGTDIKNSANWVVTADQMRNGGVTFIGCNGQESRGSSWVIDNAGLCTFSACAGLDPGRISGNIGNGAVPTVCAGLHILNGGGCQNAFNNFYVGPSVATFSPNNWGQATHAVYIEGVDSNGSGPQANVGSIITFVPTINPGGSYDPGINFRSGYGYTGGAGFTNGCNTGLSVNGVYGPAVIPGQVKDVVASALSGQVLLKWNIYFTGGAVITDYIVEYKLTSSATWLVFSDGTSPNKTATVTGLTNGLSYDFRVSATNSMGTGPVSATTTTTPVSTLQGAIASNLMDLTCADTASYIGTGQTWHNLTTAPADGAAQTAYDFFLGTNGSSEASDPTFNGTPGAQAAFFSVAGAQWFTLANGNTAFINNMHKTTGGNPWSFAMLVNMPSRASATVPWALCGSQGVGNTTDGFGLRNGDASTNVNKMTITCSTTSGGFTAAGTLSSISDISNGTYKLIVCTYNPISGKAIKGYSGNNTPFTGSVSFYSSVNNPTDSFQIFAQGGGQLPCGAGSKVVSISLFNTILTDAEVAILEAFYTTRHGFAV